MYSPQTDVWCTSFADPESYQKRRDPSGPQDAAIGLFPGFPRTLHLVLGYPQRPFPGEGLVGKRPLCVSSQSGSAALPHSTLLLTSRGRVPSSRDME